MAIGVGHNSRRGAGRGGAWRPMADINVTPLVDVMLVLLIVFMVTAPLLTAGIPVDLPDSKAKAIRVEDNSPIEITLRKDGALFIDDTKVGKEKLVPMLSEIMKTNPDRRIYIRADKKMPYGVVMKTLGLLNAAGFNKVALVSEPQKI